MIEASSEQNRAKRAAAVRAIDEVADGMVVGLGSGSTAEFALEALAARIAAGLRIVGVPTSERTAALARSLSVPITGYGDGRRIDLVIDGADQVERGSLDLIKGLGGALLREKIVAKASDRMIVVIDDTKLVDRLGAKTLLPVEIAVAPWQGTIDRLTALGCAPRLRLVAGRPFVTDGGNYIADCTIAEISDASSLDARLKAADGVIETGLFIGMATRIVVGYADRVDVIDRR